MTLTEQIASVRREIAMREAVYPKWIATKRLTEKKSEHELAAMRAVLRTLLAVAAMFANGNESAFMTPEKWDELRAAATGD